MLLHFAPQIELPDVKDYMEQVLLYAGKLTISPDVLRWGQIALVNDNTISYAVNCLFPDTFSYSEDDPSAQNVKTTLYTVFQRVCESGRPILIPNLQESSSSADSTDCPWPEAQSLLSVPLHPGICQQRRLRERNGTGHNRSADYRLFAGIFT